MSPHSKKNRMNINLGSLLLGALLGTPLGSVVSLQRINIASAIMLVFGLLVLFSQVLMQFKDRDRLRELMEFTENLEIREKDEMNDSEKDSRSD